MLSTPDEVASGVQSASWYAIHTRHQHEKVAAQVLTKNGFEVFLPLYTAVRHWKDRVKQLSLPLFPCYVFIRGGAERSREVVTTPGVHGFVQCGSRRAAIAEEEIEAVRQVVQRSNSVEPHPYLKCGDRVRVEAGPLAGIEGILVRKKNLFRLVLSVEFLEKSVAVEVDVGMVERVPHPWAGGRDWQGSTWSLGYA